MHKAYTGALLLQLANLAGTITNTRLLDMTVQARHGTSN